MKIKQMLADKEATSLIYLLQIAEVLSLSFCSHCFIAALPMLVYVFVSVLFLEKSKLEK